MANCKKIYQNQFVLKTGVKYGCRKYIMKSGKTKSAVIAKRFSSRKLYGFTYSHIVLGLYCSDPRRQIWQQLHRRKFVRQLSSGRCCHGLYSIRKKHYRKWSRRNIDVFSPSTVIAKPVATIDLRISTLLTNTICTYCHFLLTSLLTESSSCLKQVFIINRKPGNV